MGQVGDCIYMTRHYQGAWSKGSCQAQKVKNYHLHGLKVNPEKEKSTWDLAKIRVQILTPSSTRWVTLANDLLWLSHSFLNLQSWYNIKICRVYPFALVLAMRNRNTM